MGHPLASRFSILVGLTSFSEVVDHDLHGLQYYQFWRLWIQDVKTGRLARPVLSTFDPQQNYYTNSRP